MNLDSRIDELEAIVKWIEKKLEPKPRRNPSYVCSFNTTPEGLDQLKEEAAALAITRSELLRRIVKAYFDPIAINHTKNRAALFPVENADNENQLDF